MDLHKVLAEMHAERERLKTVIARLEEISGQGADSRGRRVRKGMGGAARKAASLRMKAYWEKRKQAESAAAQTAVETEEREG
jgi:hypothetical protein